MTCSYIESIPHQMLFCKENMNNIWNIMGYISPITIIPNGNSMMLLLLNCVGFYLFSLFNMLLYYFCYLLFNV